MSVRALVGSMGLVLLMSGCAAAVPETQVVTVTATPEPTSGPSTATPTPRAVAVTPTPSPTPTEAALPKVTAAEVKRIFLEYGLSYKKDSWYRDDAKWLSSASKQERDEWLQSIVRDSKSFNPGVAKDISTTSNLEQALEPWIKYFAFKAQMPVDLVDWEASYAIKRTRKSTKPVTQTKFNQWLWSDRYFRDTPGGQAMFSRMEDETAHTLSDVVG